MTRPGTLLPLLLSLLSAAAVAQNYQPDLSDPRQKTWPSPTAADWRRPCLIRWQRSWEDAVTVARKTRRPILICVNMDGEIASEHYAGVRYRHPEIAAIYNQYVCVIASVYRHNPRDYDDQGRRIPCPRFGTVTCGEHITLEPIVYKRFLDGKRIAPRHIMVELNGSEAKEIYDVYYTFDVKSVIDRVARGMKERAVKPLDIVRGDRSLVERVASRDARDREAVEKAFRKGDKELRRTLLEAAVGNRDAVPMQLFRLALFGYDLELSRVSRDALADSRNPEAIDLIAQALQVPMEEKERKSLLAALERFGEKHLKARTTAAIHRGLETGSSRIKVEEWSAKMGGSQYEPAREKSWASLVEELDSKVKEAAEKPKDAGHYLELAEAALSYAISPETWRAIQADRRNAAKYSRMVFQDVLIPARKAEKLGAKGWRLEAVMGLASYYLGDMEKAYARAEKAVDQLPPGEKSWNAMAVLSLFAVGRRQAILEAIKARKEFPPEWLTDVHAAYSVIAKHPLCQADQVAAHYDFLYSLRAFRRARRTLREGLERFPQSWELHKRFRDGILVTRGAAALEPAYRTLLQAQEEAPNLPWFAGYASLVAAECHKRAGRMEPARASYQRAIELYDRNIEARPDSQENSDHYAALALAGLARLALEAQELEKATERILASFKRHPRAAASLDGLGFTPVMTAQAIMSKLKEKKMTGAAARISRALADLEKLDPRLLEPPAYEKTATPAQPNRRARRGGRAGRTGARRPRRGERRPQRPGRQQPPRRSL